MPIYFQSDPDEVLIDFLGGDIIVGPCGDEETEAECIGIAEAVQQGPSGELAPEEASAEPTVFLRFATAASLDSLILVLQEHRKERFGDSAND